MVKPEKGKENEDKQKNAEKERQKRLNEEAQKKRKSEQQKKEAATKSSTDGKRRFFGLLGPKKDDGGPGRASPRPVVTPKKEQTPVPKKDKKIVRFEDPSEATKKVHYEVPSEATKRVKDLEKKLADVRKRGEHAHNTFQRANEQYKRKGDEAMYNVSQNALAEQHELKQAAYALGGTLEKAKEKEANEKRMSAEKEAQEKQDSARKREEEARKKQAEEERAKKESARREEERKKNGASLSMGSAVVDDKARKKIEKDRARQPRIDAEALAKGKANAEEVKRKSSSKK